MAGATTAEVKVDMDDLEKRLKANVAELKADIARLKADMADLKKDVQGIRIRIADRFSSLYKEMPVGLVVLGIVLVLAEAIKRS